MPLQSLDSFARGYLTYYRRSCQVARARLFQTAHVTIPTFVLYKGDAELCCMTAASSNIKPSSACGSIAISCTRPIPGISSSGSLQLIDILGSSIDILSSLISSAEDEAMLLRIIGVKAGDGIGDGRGVGISLIGERHLLIVLGISNSIVGGCRKLLPLLGDLCALSWSSTGTSIVPCTGLSGAPLENDIGVCMDEVEESSSPGISSCGLHAVGVLDGVTFRDEETFVPVVFDEKFRNIASMESALAGFWRPGSLPWRLLPRKSDILQLKAVGIASSELVNESLPWLLEVLLGDLASTIGEGGVLAGLAKA